MALPKKVKDYLDKKGVKYEEVIHKTVYTAYDAAQTLKRELKEIAKNLLVKVDQTYALVVLPADKRIDLKKLKNALKAKNISIPNEKVLVKVLKIKAGALSSFGQLHKLETVVDKAMLKTKKAVFSAGSLTDSVFMKVKDFIKAEEAKLADIAESAGYKVSAKRPLRPRSEASKTKGAKRKRKS